MLTIAVAIDRAVDRPSGRRAKRAPDAAHARRASLLDTAAIAASVLYLWFLAAWGLNYQREPLREQLDFSEDRITREALRTLARAQCRALNALHRDAHAAGWPELAAMPAAARAGVRCARSAISR